MVVWRWRWAEPAYREFAVKLPVALFRFLAAGAAVASRSLPAVEGGPFDQPWAATVAVCLLGFLLWEVTGVVGDHRAKVAKENREADDAADIEALTRIRESAVRRAGQLGRLLVLLRELVGGKAERIRAAVEQSAAARASIPRARLGLAPETHVQSILEALAMSFRFDVVSVDPTKLPNVRVGIYAEEPRRRGDWFCWTPWTWRPGAIARSPHWRATPTGSGSGIRRGRRSPYAAWSSAERFWSPIVRLTRRSSSSARASGYTCDPRSPIPSQTATRMG